MFPMSDPSGLSRAQHISLLQKQMQQAGADNYKLVHNHPAGEALPSEADKKITREIARDMPGFTGHVVINSGHYYTIDAQGKAERHELDTTHLWAATGGRDPVLAAAPMEVPHGLLLQKIGSTDDVAAFAQQVNIPEGYVLAFYR